ncbi:MAG: hypothetical protein KC425_06220 [Anaerolineales bacterium]|nr:hypothetical protein [Anaerolineales bacterium]
MPSKSFTLDPHTGSSLSVTVDQLSDVVFSNAGQEVARFSRGALRSGQAFQLPDGCACQVRLVLPYVGLDGLQIVCQQRDLSNMPAVARRYLRTAYLVLALMSGLLTTGVLTLLSDPPDHVGSPLVMLILIIIYLLLFFILYQAYAIGRVTGRRAWGIFAALLFLFVVVAAVADAAGLAQYLTPAAIIFAISCYEGIVGYHAFRFLREDSDK